MQVVLLAAGLGSRLGALTERLPKALVPVAGEPLVGHALRFAARLLPSHVIVVGGYGFPLVAAEVAKRRLPETRAAAEIPLTLVENSDFRDGNLVSLLAARRYLNEDFVLLNVDHIFKPAIAPLVAASAEDITAFIDTDRALGDDDMKVERDAKGRVSQISKTLTAFDAGYVGMTRVPRSEMTRYWAEVDSALAEEGRAIHVERILARLARTNRPPACRDVSGHGWLEVDTPDERTRAEEALRDPGWR